jgi:beta-lactamase superfamily II metal-dependent hydrolase
MLRAIEEATEMSITLRAYNVLFGDALLVSWDEDDGPHHAWVDFGNFHNDANAVFEKVYNDVLARTAGKLDLLVITHRHLDHMEGFFSLRKRFKTDFTIQRLWHTHVTPSLDHVFEIAERTLRSMLPASIPDGDTEIGRVFRNNFGAKGDKLRKQMGDILKEIGVPASRTFKIHRDLNLKQALPPGLKQLDIEVFGPEKNSKRYLQPLEHALRVRGIAISAVNGRIKTTREDPFDGARAVKFRKSPLAGLADLARLRRQLQSGGLNVLAAVDTTRNNTSIVMRLTHGSARLLLVGDAEEMSWEIMRKNGAPLEADVIKVGHHGSINASPDWSFTAVMPTKLAGNAAVISTDDDRFTGENEVPKDTVLNGWRGRLKKRSRLLRTDSKNQGESVAVKLEG